jgi:hypothetical protein
MEKSVTYDVIITTLRDRADLLERTIRSMLPRLDLSPARLIVHEDVRPNERLRGPSTRERLEAIERETGIPFVLMSTEPARGLARAMPWLLAEASTEFVFYTQEDFDFVRDVPVSECLALMHEHRLHHVRFNKRKTMRIKGADRAPEQQFHKIEKPFGGRILTVSDHWYFQASMWRTSIAREGFEVLNQTANAGVFIDRGEMKFNHWLNTTHGKGIGSTDSTGAAQRGEFVRTYIWGGIGEPAFIQHTGHDRSSQNHPGHT